MERVRFLVHKGKQILCIDFSGASPQETFDVIKVAQPLIAKEPPASVRTMTVVAGLHFNNESSKALKEYAAANKPFVKAAAIVGLSGLQRIIYEGMLLFTRRQMSTFGDVESAKDWLAAQ